jgi:hypothetical protein
MIKDIHVVTPFPIGPAKILPCPTNSIISTRFFTFGLFTTLMMEAVRTSETSVSFNNTTWHYIQDGCHPLRNLLKL